MKIDEDRASKYVKKPTGFLDTEHSDRCSFDHASLTSAFAAHREKATAELVEALRDIIDALDAPRYGDDTVWDDLNGFCSSKPGPLERARLALTKANGDE